MRDAALGLFAQDGFAEVTVEQIATAVGVTQRTFFRHFPTKEDVLFSEGDAIVANLSAAVQGAPKDARSSDVLLAALKNLAATFEPDRAHHRSRASIIESDPALRERELLKRHQISQVIGEEFVRRGTPRARAARLAGVGMVVFEVAYNGWVTDQSRTSLAVRIARTLAETTADLSA